MRIQLLVPTMHASDFSKVSEMNLWNVDVIFANQTDRCSWEEKVFPERGVSALMISTNTLGVSLNRNIALAHANADIIVFSDDDQQFTEDFAQVVAAEFETHPEADVIKFNCKSVNSQRPLSYHAPSQFKKANFWTMMSAGVPGLALRRERFEKYDILFPNSLGPGREYNCGEDSVFIQRLLHSPLRIYRSPSLISYIRQDGSSWFRGYDAHYFLISGYVYGKLYGRLALPMLIRKAWKLRKKSALPVRDIIRLQRTGMRRYCKNISEKS